MFLVQLPESSAFVSHSLVRLHNSTSLQRSSRFPRI